MLKPIFGLLVLLGLLALKAKGTTDYNDVGLDCWDVCFMEASDEQESQEAVEFYYTLVEKLRFMRMYYGVNTTGKLIWYLMVKLLSSQFMIENSNFGLNQNILDMGQKRKIR